MMICKNCGNELGENVVFCEKCGFKVEPEVAENAEVQEAEVVENVMPETLANTANMEAPRESLPEKKKNKKWIVFTAIAVIVALLATGVVFAFPYINNTFWGVVLSDEDYFKHAVENNSSDYMGDVAEVYADFFEMYKNDETVQYDVKLELGQKTKDLVTEYSNGSLKLDWFKNISVNGQSGYKDGKIYQSATYSVNDQKFTDFNMVADSNAVYMDLPGLSDGGLRSEPQGDSELAYQVLSAFYEIAPDEEVFEELFVRYVNCLTEGVTKVEKTKETVKAGDVSSKYTKLSAKIDEEVTEKAIVAVLTMAKDDEDIKKLITDFCNSSVINEDADEVYGEFKEAVEDLIDDVDLDGEEFEFDFNIWVDGKGDIVGMGVDFDGGEVYYVNALDGTNMGTVLEVKVPDFTLTFEGTGKLSSGKYSADYNLSVAGMSVLDVKLTEVDYKLAKEGVFDGKVEIALAEGAKGTLKAMGDDMVSLLADTKIAISSKTVDDKEYKAELAISSGNEALLTATINTNVAKAAMPDISKYVDADDSDLVNKWSKTLGENFIKKLSDLGFSIASPAGMVSPGTIY